MSRPYPWIDGKSVAARRLACNGAPVPMIHFDERIAAGYDATSTDMFDPAVLDPTVDFLAELAAGGAALELGIGTGRVALPLSHRGVPVHGIELSPTMVERLRAKPGADAIGCRRCAGFRPARRSERSRSTRPTWASRSSPT
jgi:hypothetical protein